MSKMIKRKKKKEAAESVVRMSELESLRLGKIDAEIRNAMQGIKLMEFEVATTRNQATEKISNLEFNKKKLQADIDRLRPTYEALVKEIATKYGIDDPKNLVFDPDSGIVHDSRSLTVKETQ